MGSEVSRSYRYKFFMSLAVASALTTAATAQDLDVQIQAENGRLVIGLGDVDLAEMTQSIVIGQRVFTEVLGASNFQDSDPGFNIEPTGSPVLPPGITGLGPGVDVFFDFVPTTIRGQTSTLFFWDGSDASGNGLSIDDVALARPTGSESFRIRDFDFEIIDVPPSEELIPGGLISTTSQPVPLLMLPGGRLHEHLILGVFDNDGNPDTLPADGLYVTALQVRAAGFETSDPFFFVHATPATDPLAIDLAAQFLDDNYDEIVFPQLAGDFDGNGVVDVSDYSLWRDQFGQTVAEPGDGADGNRDGLVDAADYTIWRDNLLPATVLQAATSIPEPSAAGIILIGFSLGLLRRQSRGEATQRERRISG